MSIRTKDARPTERPTWDEYWTGVGNETWLYARELIELTQTIKAHFASFLRWDERPVMVEVPGRPSWDPGEPDPDGWVWRDSKLDWKAAAAAADEWPCSSTERRMLDLVLSLVQPDEEGHHERRTDDEGDYEVWVTTGTRKLDARGLGDLGSWRDEVADILFRYIKGEMPTPPQRPGR